MSEPQLLQCDLELRTAIFKGQYSCSLNSSDLYDKDEATKATRTFGGTMILWKKEYDPFVAVYPTDTTAFLPIVFSPPGVTISIHVSIYLPTQGKENEFLEALSKLDVCLSEMKQLYPGALVYLRGDFNTSRTNITRTGLLDFFSSSNNLCSVKISHRTYHHFLGNGVSDSHLDRLLYSDIGETSEELVTIICKLTNPLVNSHHDVLVSSVQIPCDASEEEPPKLGNVVAPRVENSRTKILWTDIGIETYRDTVAKSLQHIQDLWLQSPSTASLHVALQATNSVMAKAACLTNNHIPLGKPHPPLCPSS